MTIRELFNGSIDVEILTLVYVACGLVFYGIYSRFIIDIFTVISKGLDEWLKKKLDMDNPSLVRTTLIFFPYMFLMFIPTLLGFISWMAPIFFFVWLLIKP